jgi:6-phosphogluconate dehydrogenase (decarboxylating)
MKIGFIGLGMMGAGMASNLQKAGHDLVVHDITRQSASKHLAAERWPRLVTLSLLRCPRRMMWRRSARGRTVS